MIRRLMILNAVVLAIIVLVAMLSACSTPSHNEFGGYTEACGDLPPLVGDDC